MRSTCARDRVARRIRQSTMVALLGATSLAPPAAADVLHGSSAPGARPGVLYIGDSLGVGTTDQLGSMATGLSLEADVRVGRTSSEALPLLRAELRSAHEIVVFDVGTNDADASTLAHNLSRARVRAGNRLMLVFTINGRRAQPLNRAVRGFARAHDDVVLIPWRRVARHEHLLTHDGIHANASGYRTRAKLVLHDLLALTGVPDSGGFRSAAARDPDQPE